MEGHTIGPLFIRQALFEQAKRHMETAFQSSVSDNEAEDILRQNQPLLSSIIGYDEIDTEDRHRIWDCCKLPDRQ